MDNNLTRYVFLIYLRLKVIALPEAPKRQAFARRGGPPECRGGTGHLAHPTRPQFQQPIYIFDAAAGWRKKEKRPQTTSQSSITSTQLPIHIAHVASLGPLVYLVCDGDHASGLLGLTLEVVLWRPRRVLPLHTNSGLTPPTFANLHHSDSRLCRPYLRNPCDTLKCNPKGYLLSSKAGLLEDLFR